MYFTRDDKGVYHPANVTTDRNIEAAASLMTQMIGMFEGTLQATDQSVKDTRKYYLDLTEHVMRMVATLFESQSDYIQFLGHYHTEHSQAAAKPPASPVDFGPLVEVASQILGLASTGSAPDESARLKAMIEQHLPDRTEWANRADGATQEEIDALVRDIIAATATDQSVREAMEKSLTIQEKAFLTILIRRATKAPADG